MLETLMALRRSGIAVDVFALNPSRQRRDPSALDQVCNAYASADVSTEVRPLQLMRSLIAAPSAIIAGERVPLSYWISRFIDQRALDLLQRFVEQHGPYDVVHCETLFTVYYGLAVHPSSAPAVVYRSHNVEWRIQDRLAKESSTSFPVRFIRRVLARQTQNYESWISRRVEAIATISANDAAWYSQHVRDSVVRELHPGISLQPVFEKIDCGNTIGFLGSLDWEPNRKGLVWFIDQVLPFIAEQVPDVCFSIAGRGSKNFCRSLNLPSNAVCIGEVDSVSQFYESQAIAVAPLLSGSGIRIKLLEAFSLSTPVVTTSQGAEGLNVHHGRECMIADDPRLFAQACVELLRDRAMRDSCARAAHTFVETHYSHEAVATTLVQLYRQILERF